jgi:hypothetical protein
MLLLLLPQISRNRSQVIVKPLCVLPPRPADFLNHGVCIHD